jgi:RNA polymerase-binding transcription factor DksA
MLLDERARLMGMHREWRRQMEEEGRENAEDELAVSDFNEPADIAAPLVDIDRDAAQDANLMGEIHQIDKALARMDQGLYGICEITGQPIPVERLRVLPWATTVVEVADQMVQ